MKDISSLLALALMTCASSAAQDTPKAEIFLGYTYVRVNSATNVPAFSANGGGGQFVEAGPVKHGWSGGQRRGPTASFLWHIRNAKDGRVDRPGRQGERK